MKTIHIIIAASIILNVALFIYAKPFVSRTRAAPTRIQTQKPAAKTVPALNLKTATPEQLVQKLTALDFPPDLIKSIVSSRLYMSKMMPLFMNDDPRYWRAHDMFEGSKYTELLTATREMDETMTRLFGADYKDPRKMDDLRRKYGDLSDEKLRALAEIDDKDMKQFHAYGERRAKGTATDEDKDYWKTSARQKREEVSKILTPDELSEYNMRASTASFAVRNETRLFDVKEQEFRDMTTVYQKIYDSENPDASSEFATQKDRDNFRDEQFRQILGDERFADYQQAKNRDYEKLNLIVQRLELPISAAREVVSVQNDLVKRAAAIDADASLNNAERAEQYGALAQEARERITRSLGERGYAAYRENSKNWIQALEGGKAPGRAGR